MSRAKNVVSLYLSEKNKYVPEADMGTSSSYNPKEKNIFLKVVEMVKDKKIKSTDEFIAVLKNEGINIRKYEKMIHDVFDGKNKDEIILLGKYLGPEGINLLPLSWLSRKFTDKDVVTLFPLKSWNLFRNQEWVNRNEKEYYLNKEE